ncbi:MAG: translocation/assembly module TamB domain-containing protein, partial [Pseudomonadales bacterium]|nr:translocation/assembly module TamB domain-containing protein [Pseudomonadales bacterium]
VVVNAPAGVSRDTEVLKRIPVQGKLALGLGDDVRVRAQGLELQLQGELDVEQTTGRSTLTYGEVAITEGRYRIYGQELKIDNGKLLFFGNMLNPALDIRAYRQVRETVVGVQINGTIRNMESHLFSTPALPDSEVLSMLITGKSFKNIGSQDSDSLLASIANLGIEQGQGLTNSIRNKLGLDAIEVDGGSNLYDSSLGLGKYLTEDIFMSYKLGLFDRQSTLGVDYTLTDRIKLEVKSGISQSVDITYTVEK